MNGRSLNRDNNVGRYRLHWTSSSWRRLRQIIRPHTGRLIRFAVTGGLAGIVQLSVLQALTGMGWHGLPANALGILASTQVNFVLSALFIWRDRDIRGQWRRRWAEFHLATLATTLLNLFVFVLAELFVPRLIAAVLGIGVAGLVNYLIEDNLVFRPAARRNRTVHRGAPLKLLPLDEAADD